MNFAALEQRTNAAVFAHLANVMATVAGVANVPGIFDKPYAGYDMVAGNKPVLQILESSVSGVADGSSVVIGADAYTVAGEPQRDRTGMVMLVLREG